MVADLDWDDALDICESPLTTESRTTPRTGLKAGHYKNEDSENPRGHDLSCPYREKKKPRVKRGEVGALERQSPPSQNEGGAPSSTALRGVTGETHEHSQE
jgi:hypothetical protein